MSKQSEYEWLQERENQEAIDRQFSDEEEIGPDMDIEIDLVKEVL